MERTKSYSKNFTRKKKILTVQTMTKVAMLGSIAAILMTMNFYLPIFPSFLKLDLSDVPAMIAAISLGPIPAVLTQLVKVLLKAVFNTKTMWLGELSNFIVGSALVLPLGLIYQSKKTDKSLIFALVVATFTSVLFAAMSNYFIMIPAFAKVMGKTVNDFVVISQAIMPAINTFEKLILFAVVPFNFLKIIIEAFLLITIYKTLLKNNRIS